MRYLYFSATWCGPCKMLKPTMKKVEAEGIEVENINVDNSTEMISYYSVRSVPTIILVDDTGKEYARTIGVKPLSHFIEQYNSFNDVQE